MTISFKACPACMERHLHSNVTNAEANIYEVLKACEE